MQYIYTSIEDSEVVLVFECNKAVFKKLSSFSKRTSNSSAFINTMCLLKHVLNCEQYFSFIIFRFGLSDIRINCNRVSEVFLYIFIEFQFENSRKETNS
jgi:hypothetical protein